PETQTIAQGSTAVFTVTPDANNQIVSVTGCDGTLVDNTYTTGEITAACAVEATFAPILYSIATLVTGNGSIDPGNATRQQGDSVSFTVTADDGYQIDSVSGCEGVLSGNSFEIVNLASNCLVEVEFSLIEQAVTNRPSTPSFNLPSAEYEGWASVLISSSSADAMIRYTLDGSTPTATNGILLANGGTVELSDSVTIKAVAFNSDLLTSDVIQASYDITSTSVSGGGAMHPLWMLIIAFLAFILRRQKTSFSTIQNRLFA
ncbi:MAG: FN3 associated domain-containing protein, partial [Oleibacter sp.]|nr:FN3 associated domain-containing protein [Thalassolituus sp.]